MSTTSTQTSSPLQTVPTRRMEFEESFEDVPKHFADEGDLLSSHLISALSSVFPDGEDYFVRSVRHFRKDVSDPVLKEQVKGFIGQESVHGREHRAFNDRLAELGYPTKESEAFTRKVLAFRTKVMSPKANLATTAALEHFTATLAEHVLTNEETRRRMGHQAVQDLFVWHALEESEHKAVAFDVYRAVGGTERMRIWSMKAIRAGFVVGLVISMVLAVARDRSAWKPGVLRRSWKRFKSTPMLSREVWDQLKDYDRKGFHPNDRDTVGLVESWRAELFGDTGSLNDKLSEKDRAKAAATTSEAA